MIRNYTFTSESVSPGHPDKIADQISDAILDYFLTLDRNARVAVETFVTTDFVLVGGEIKTIVDYTSDTIEKIVRKTIADIGDNMNFHAETVEVKNLIHAQSEDISIGVDRANGTQVCAGDQGIMFGFACKENPQYMPTPILLCHRILKKLWKVYKDSGNIKLGPDAKTQVSVVYRDGVPIGIDRLVLSAQHTESMTTEDVTNMAVPIILSALPENMHPEKANILINKTGKFVIGGPTGDAGLTGRKIIVDTYGGYAPHGGGAFSGKDYSKVDRSASYMARFVAKNLVHHGIADKLTIQVCYCIGMEDPLEIFVDTHNTSKYSDSQIIDIINNNFSFRPQDIMQTLQLTNPIYQKTATFGHFGRDSEGDFFTWEKLLDDLR